MFGWGHHNVFRWSFARPLKRFETRNYQEISAWRRLRTNCTAEEYLWLCIAMTAWCSRMQHRSFLQHIELRYLASGSLSPGTKKSKNVAWSFPGCPRLIHLPQMDPVIPPCLCCPNSSWKGGVVCVFGATCTQRLTIPWAKWTMKTHALCHPPQQGHGSAPALARSTYLRTESYH